jgi:hypothetical protein
MSGESPSPRVRLEVAFLDDHQTAPAPAPPLDEQARLTALIVAADADVRRQVRECLRAHSDLRILDAATLTEALALEDVRRLLGLP